MEIALATKWLDALRRKDVAAMIEVTSYPFVLHDTQNQGTCKDRQLASRPNQVATTVKCLLTNDWPDRALERNPKAFFGVLSYVPDWGKAWSMEMSSDLLPLDALADAPGCEFNFVFLVAKNGVRAVWKAGSAIRDEEIRPPDLPIARSRSRKSRWPRNGLRRFTGATSAR